MTDIEKNVDATRPLGKSNFILMAVSVACVIIGFLITGSGELRKLHITPTYSVRYG